VKKCQATDEHGFAQMKREDLSVLTGVNPWLRSIFSHDRSGCATVSHAPSLCPRHFPASFIGGFRFEDESNCRGPKRLLWRHPLGCFGEREGRQYAALWRGKRRYVRGTPWRARTSLPGACGRPSGAGGQGEPKPLREVGLRLRRGALPSTLTRGPHSPTSLSAEEKRRRNEF
jgi:hypothetical protein